MQVPIFNFMITKAQEKLDQSRFYTQAAYQALSDITVNHCEGWDQFSSEELELLKNVIHELIECRLKTGNLVYITR